MAKASYIYALCDPRSGGIRYIGKSNNPAQRYKQHMAEMRRDYPLYRWIAKLRKEKVSPVMRILCECTQEDWAEHEIMAIDAAKAEGAVLLNVAVGGVQPSCPLEVRQSNGRSNAKKRVNTADKKRIYEIKRALSQLLKQGYVSEDTKKKMRYAAFRAPKLFGLWANI